MFAWTIVQALHCQARNHLPMILHALRALVPLTSADLSYMHGLLHVLLYKPCIAKLAVARPWCCKH